MPFLDSFLVCGICLVILVLLIVMAAIVSLNVFNPKVPNNCVSVYPITCADIKLDSDKIFTIVLSSVDTIDAETKLDEIKLNSPTPQSGVYSCTNVVGGSPCANCIPADNQKIYSCTFAQVGVISKETKFDGNAKITYKLSGGTNPHIINLKFSGSTE